VFHRPDWRESLHRPDQRFEAGDDVEQFLVDAALAQTMECPVEVLQQFVDVLVRALDRPPGGSRSRSRGIRRTADSLSCHAIRALWLVREELPEMQLPDPRVMGFEGLPCRKCGNRARCFWPCSFPFRRVSGRSRDRPPDSGLHVRSIAAVYSPRRAARLHLAR
jgi:hypothetical protein